MQLVKWCNRVIEYSFYALFFLVPLVFTNSTSELFEFNKMWLTFALTLAIGTAWATKMVCKRQIYIQKTPFDIPLILFLISHLVSTIFSLDTRTSIWGYYSRFNGGLLSIFSYILLYYAFVTFYREHVTENENTPHKHSSSSFFKYSLFTRTLSIASAIIIFPLGLFTAQLFVPDSSTGHPLMFLLCILTSFILFLYGLPRLFLHRILFISLFSGIIVALWGVPAHFGSDPSCFMFRGTFDVSCWTEAFQPTVRIFSTLGQPAWLAAYAALLLPFSFGYFLRLEEKQKTKQSVINLFKKFLPLSTVSILFYLSLLYANTRAGFLAFWLSQVLLLFLLALNHFKHKTLRLRFVGFSLFAFCLMAFSIISSSYTAWFTSIIVFIAILSYLLWQKHKAFLLLQFVLLILTFFNQTPFPEINKYFSLSSLTAKHTSETVKTEKPSGTVLESGGSESGEIRKIVWKGALNAWKTSPLFGTGVETFAYAYYQNKPVEHNLTSEWDYLYNKAHNEYLNYLTTTGIFGFGAYMLFIFLFLFLSIKYCFKSRPEDNTSSFLLAIGLIAGFISILVTNFFGFSVVIINLYFFLIPAFFLAVTGQLETKRLLLLPKKASEKAFGIADYTILSILWLFFAWMIILLLRFWYADSSYALGHNLASVGQYEQAYTPLQEAYTLRSKEPVIADELALTSAALAYGWHMQKAEQKANEFTKQAIELSNDVVQAHPHNVVYWKDRVRIFFTLSQIDPQYSLRALEGIRKASELAPTDAKISYNLGVLYGQTNNLEQGISALRRTIELKPNYRDAYFALAVLLRQKATENTDKTIKYPEIQKEAQDALKIILQKINPKDEAAEKLLKSWGAN